MIDRLGVCLLAASVGGWWGGVLGALFAGLAMMIVIGVVDGIRLLLRLLHPE